MKSLRWGVCGLLLLTAVSSTAQESGPLSAPKDRASYALGVETIRNLMREGGEFNLDLMVQGMRDGLAGKELLMTDKEIRKAMNDFTSSVRQKHAQLRRIAAEENRKKGDAFLSANASKPGVVSLPSGVQYRVIRAGEGKKPTDADTVLCNYRGTLVDGKEFDATEPGKPEALKLSQLIAGWKEALKLMPTGSRWEIVVPSKLAFGARGAGRDIGPNDTLIFDVELLAIQ